MTGYASPIENTDLRNLVFEFLCSGVAAGVSIRVEVHGHQQMQSHAKSGVGEGFHANHFGHVFTIHGIVG